MTVLLLIVASLCLLCRLRWGVGVMVCWCRRRKKNVSRRTFGRWTGVGVGHRVKARPPRGTRRPPTALVYMY